MNSNLFNPTFLSGLCDKYELRPSKAYGQNYLISENVISKIVEAADIKKDDLVVEIGPGFGVLTFALAEKAKQVYAFEIERKIFDYWQEKQQEHKNIEIIWGNALKELQNFLEERKIKNYKLVANLPYQITSNILRVILEQKNKPEKIVVMVQKEVADRIVAKKGDMNLLGLSIQIFGTPKIMTKVSAGSFWPAPKVDSAVVAIENIKEFKDVVEFFKLAHAGFASKRKQLWKNLSNVVDLPPAELKEIVKKISGNELNRAEDLDVGEWINLVELVRSKSL